MTKTLRSCKHCGIPLREDDAQFRVSGDTEPGAVIGTFCRVKCYLAERYGPERVEEAYRAAFIPVERSHGDADTLQPEERIVP